MFRWSLPPWQSTLRASHARLQPSLWYGVSNKYAQRSADDLHGSISFPEWSMASKTFGCREWGNSERRGADNHSANPGLRVSKSGNGSFDDDAAGDCYGHERWNQPGSNLEPAAKRRHLLARLRHHQSHEDRQWGTGHVYRTCNFS